MMKRVILIVLDSVGVGEMPDAAEYGDEGSNTLGNVAKAVDGLSLRHLADLGLGRIIPIQGVPAVDEPKGAWGKMAESSSGKDTTTGHWEIAGLQLAEPFPTYPDGFPADLLEKFCEAIGVSGVLGNKTASGTAIIEELGPEHLQTGHPIVYTSADSVFQIAAHEDVVAIETLYSWCETAREQLRGPHAVGRVIARPFEGEPGGFQRTTRRRDFSLEPTGTTILDSLVANDIPVYGVGKISDIFAGRGISDTLKSHDNMETVDKTLQFMDRSHSSCLIFANLVDFDMLWGHRNDPESYGRGLEEFDARLPELLAAMEDEDMLIILADHGCDPTTSSTDHSREYVPLLVYGSRIQPVDLGVRSTFADVAKTLARFFDIEAPVHGTSFLNLLWKG